MADQMDRRGFLRLSAAAAAAVAAGSALGACGGGDGDSASGTTTRPTTTRPAGRLSDIDHVVILFQENRSFDQLFGTRKGVRGFGDTDVLTLPSGKPVWYQPSTTNPDGYILPWLVTADGASQCAPDVDHSWQGQHLAWNDGKMDGWAQHMGPFGMAAFGRGDLPWYHAVADEFTLCDSWFCSVLGPTNPNRHYSMSGTIDPGGKGGGPATDNSGTAYTWETYPERLQKAGISWRVYHDVDDYGDNALAYYQQYHDLPKTDPLYDSAMRPRTVEEFEADCAKGDLPQVSWIVAPEALSEHPVWAPAAGQAYVARHVAAIMGNPDLWAKTVFILSYDENGGFFDHVPPPVPEPGTPDEFVAGKPIGLGLRVPGLVVSPWSRGGKVNSDVFDHTSTLMFLEKRFGVEVPNLSAWRRATCGDLTSTLDLTAKDTSVPSLPDAAAKATAARAVCDQRLVGKLPSPQALPAVEA